ncbi:phytoene dehydrogenase-like oxidoreductase [Desulfocapsa sulfexigens DSM 10523]|uniref:Phytoene dehydrogenase-like oxidoreductase n=1 Tax=Desulfocapsa sulfexigens (strain DSM 10523 / SB164P1) TaxID=1167006 RepID=M1PA74_DESSD|nr:FAD-dependent oxidoreductase [Desulfocapsa sulfexigens]AGF76705.1 phytoene dehydrogenase-like oxidoreductase [Desulfocapsa sulfexigens DSM 10523]
MKHDAEKLVIVGSGIGGLSSGIILAGLGYDVTVVEKNRRAGGLLRSYTRDGMECEVGVHYLGSLGKGQVLRKFFDYLGVRDVIPVTPMGTSGVIDRYLFDAPATHPPQFDLPVGFDAYENNLRKAFPAETSCIENVVAAIRKSSEQLHSLDALYATEDFSLLDQTEPYGDILDQLGCSPGLRSVLAIPSSWIGVSIADCPAYYHNMALASYLSSSWRLEKSGAHMADVLVDRFKALGGKLITSAEVSSIAVDSRVVGGVRLESGEYLPASIVIGAVHPQVVLRMLPDGAVKPSYRNRIKRLENTHSIFAVHARIDADTHPEVPHNTFKVETDVDGNITDLKYYQFRKNKTENSTLLSILTSGNDALWEDWRDSKTGRRDAGYGEAKNKLASALVAEAEELFGPLKRLKMVDAYTPLTIRDWVNSPDGSAYGVLRSSSQTLATALLNRTAVQGLYLAGQNVVAPGVIGTIMGSFSTVKLILGPEEFRKKICL